MRIAVCEFGNETNTFRKGLSDFAALAPLGWVKAEELLGRFKGSAQYIGGMIRAAGEEEVELVPLSSVTISAGPLIAREALEYIVGHICKELAPHKDEIDGICFSLHGAGCAENTDDIESYTIKALRGVVGDDMPITASMDLHGNMTDELMGLCQGLFCIKENPHVDCEAAGYLAMKTLISTIRGECKPQMAHVKLPLLVTPATGNTYNEPMKSVKEHFAAYCREHGLIDVTLFHGFSAADHPESSASVLVVADGFDPIEHARTLARYFWGRRAEFLPESLSPDEAIDRALTKIKDGYVVINEISDNPGSGCPGDGTYLLRALLKRDLPGTLFEYIRDGEVALQAHEAGVGAVIDITLGGKTDDMHGSPIELKGVEVLALSDGSFPYTSPIHDGLMCEMGLMARLRHGNVEFIVVTQRKQTVDNASLTATGGDIKNYRIVCLKSANHFRGYFESRADAIVTADPPGARCSNLKTYPYKRIKRPIYPLDEDCSFEI